MSPGLQYVQEQATKAAANRLRQAATIAALHIKNPLFQKRVGRGADAMLVRFEWPGILAVYDLKTGEQLAISECGHPDVLRAGFLPPWHTLISPEKPRNF